MADWLRRLIARGHIAPGEVDERGIEDVKIDDLAGFAQHHFFAGIGGWSYALRLAGWPDDQPIWTGSCPCQPFSAAGQGKAADDKRHLWPVWFDLIRQFRPAGLFGEQVEAAIGWGWLDLVLADLERESYACAAAVLPACSIGAPHIRPRIFYLAYSDRYRRQGADLPERTRRQGAAIERGSAAGELAHAEGARRKGKARRRIGGQPDQEAAGLAEHRGVSQLGDAVGARSQKRKGNGRVQRQAVGTPARQAAERRSDANPWTPCDWLPCIDGKLRATKPGLFPLASGVSGRVGRLRGYGNSIVPHLAAEFVIASVEAIYQATSNQEEERNQDHG